jgi:hypothetical protein
MKTFLVSFVIFALPGLAVSENIKYFAERPFAYDLSRVISRNEFNEQNLTWRLSRFAELQKHKHPLSRLAMSFREIDLWYEHPSEEGHINPANYNGEWNRQQSLAEVFCLNGAASALIKIGDSVKSIQISGNRDPRIMTVDGRTARILSFAIHSTDSAGFDGFPHTSSRDWITFFVTTTPLLSPEQAEQLQAELSEAIGTRAVALVVRSDPAFGPNGGPIFDCFHFPFPDIPLATYRVTPYIECLPLNEPKPNTARLQHTCKITRPPHFGVMPQ